MNKSLILIISLFSLVLLLAACGDQGGGTAEGAPTVVFHEIGNTPADKGGPIFTGQNDVSVEVFATAGSAKVAYVELMVDGTRVAKDEVSSFKFEIDLLGTGTYELSAVAIDINGLKSEAVVQKVAVDATPPSVTILNPDEGAIVQGAIRVDVSATDEESGISKITVFFGGQLAGEQAFDGGTTESLELTLPVSGDEAVLPDGTYDIEVVATNAVGVSNPEPQTVSITTRNEGSPPASPIVEIDPALIEPGPISPTPVGCADPSGQCYGGRISVPVRVDAPIGTKVVEVTLLVESKARGTSQQTAPSTPATFDIDTTIYPNNDVLTIRSQAITAAGGTGVTAGSIKLTVFNPAPPPTLSITSPADGAEVNGLLTVSVSVNQLSDSGYTLDLNNDGAVDGEEGFEIILKDFTGLAIERIYFNEAVAATRSGNYIVTPSIDTTEYANDTYRLIVHLPACYTGANSNCDASDPILPLTRTIDINTNNTNRVPPSLLILSPTDERDTNIKTIRDPNNAFVIFRVSDNTGIAHVELRMYEGDPTQDATPSRDIIDLGGAVLREAALPINFNADPYLFNGTYTARLIAEDVDGNRTFQDVRVNIARGTDISYDLNQVGPLTDPTDPSSVINPVPPNVPITLAVSGGSNGFTYDHLVRLPGSGRYEYLGSSGPSYSIGFAEEGTYIFLTQVTTADGDIYLTDTVGVGVKESE